MDINVDGYVYEILKLNNTYFSKVKVVVMSSSSDFPGYVKLKSFRAKLSRAGHFNFWAETELDFFFNI